MKNGKQLKVCVRVCVCIRVCVRQRERERESEREGESEREEDGRPLAEDSSPDVEVVCIMCLHVRVCTISFSL